jgi:hypothetical protein
MRAACLMSIAFLVAFCVFAGDKVNGTFVQKKSLHDVGVTLTSSGTWSFEKDVAFVWNTLKPVPSLFVATPTNYSFTVGGRITSRRLDMKIENIAQVFEMKEMKGVVEKVESSSANPVFKAEGVEIPSSMRVFFKNGDRLEISLKR